MHLEVNQKVISDERGIGTVTRIRDIKYDNKYVYLVEFEDGENSYTIDGWEFDDSTGDSIRPLTPQEAYIHAAGESFTEAAIQPEREIIEEVAPSIDWQTRCQQLEARIEDLVKEILSRKRQIEDMADGANSEIAKIRQERDRLASELDSVKATHSNQIQFLENMIQEHSYVNRGLIQAIAILGDRVRAMSSVNK